MKCLKWLDRICKYIIPPVFIIEKKKYKLKKYLIK